MNPIPCVAVIGALTIFAVEACCAETTTNTAGLLEGFRKKYDLPGLAVAVVKDGKVVDRTAVGIRKVGESTPMTADDVFHIGSCTKSMTATVAAILIQDGKLRWDTTIAEVFPGLKGKMDKQYEAVTVEQLMTHRGGVPHAPPPSAWRRAWQKQGTSTEQRYEFIKAVLGQPPEVPPGTKMLYSNQGFAILGAMLEKVTGKSWEDLMKEKLFGPLHMKSAGFGTPGTIGKVDQPWGHTRESGVLKPTQGDNPPAIGPAGTVHASLEDLARYALLHLKPMPEGATLKPETLERLHTAPDGSDYACGWVCAERDWGGGKVIWHNGSNTAWYIVMWLAPKRDFAVIAVCNASGKQGIGACDDAASAMIKQWLPKS